MRARLQALHGRDATQGYLMIAPAAIVLLLLIAYPFGLSLWISMTNASIGNPGHFVGLANFTNQLTSEIFRIAFRNTVWYTFVTTIIKLVLGFALALLLNREFRGRKFVRAAMLLPWIVPSVLSTMAWLWLFDSNLSSLNWLLKNLHLTQKNLPFLTDPNWAMGCIMAVNVWRGTPFLGITILAVLQTVPKELYEAAAARWRGCGDALYQDHHPARDAGTHHWPDREHHWHVLGHPDRVCPDGRGANEQHAGARDAQLLPGFEVGAAGGGRGNLALHVPRAATHGGRAGVECAEADTMTGRKLSSQLWFRLLTVYFPVALVLLLVLFPVLLDDRHLLQSERRTDEP